MNFIPFPNSSAYQCRGPETSGWLRIASASPEVFTLVCNATGKRVFHGQAPIASRPLDEHHALGTDREFLADRAHAFARLGLQPDG